MNSNGVLNNLLTIIERDFNKQTVGMASAFIARSHLVTGPTAGGGSSIIDVTKTDNIAITNEHCVRNYLEGRAAEMIVYGQQICPTVARVAAVSHKDDIAILRIFQSADFQNQTGIPIRRYAAKRGEKITQWGRNANYPNLALPTFCLNNPYEDGPFPDEGRCPFGPTNLIHSSLWRGSSGGTATSEDGYVVAVCHHQQVSAPFNTLATPCTEVVQVLLENGFYTA